MISVDTAVVGSFEDGFGIFGRHGFEIFEGGHERGVFLLIGFPLVDDTFINAAVDQLLSGNRIRFDLSASSGLQSDGCSVFSGLSNPLRGLKRRVPRENGGQ